MLDDTVFYCICVISLYLLYRVSKAHLGPLDSQERLVYR